MGRPRRAAGASSSASRKATGKAPTYRRSTRSTRSSNILQDVLDSDESSAEEDLMEDLNKSNELPHKPQPKIKKTASILKEVYIPSRREDSLMKREKQPSADRTPSTLPSSANYSDYDTPMTSNAVTPAEPLAFKETMASTPLQNSTRVYASDRLHQLQKSQYALTTSKRKRCDGEKEEESSEDDDPDAKLARKLQEEEYSRLPKPQAKSRNLNSRRPKMETEDSDDGLSDLSSLHKSDESFSLSLSMKRRRTVMTSTKPNQVPKVAFGSEVDSGEEMLFEDESSEGDTSSASDELDRSLPPSNLHPPNRSVSPLVQGIPRSRRGRRSRAATERLKLERQHPDIITLWDDLKKTPPITPIPAKQPEAITRKLKPFQLEGLDWMIKQEKTKWKGGLLGDEMGMGKTIQAVSLIMSDYPQKNPTLVVVPPVALMQWQSEINEYTDGKLKVLVYHRSNPKIKHMKKEDLEGYDIIMISYSGLESIYRKESKGWKRDDGLVKEDSMIHAIHYHRLVLDEAHSIKSRTTGVAKACFALQADYKWCLSGTPVQNKIGEFFSLLRFIEVKPFACYFCKSCSCSELHWAQGQNRHCLHCGHRGLDHVSVFNQEILNPITQLESIGKRREALQKLRLLTDRIMLRRMKQNHTSSMELPPKEVIIHNEFFGEIERDFSSSIMSDTSRQFDTYVSRGVMLDNYANIFGLLMQMRQTADHPDLILKKSAAGGQNVLICSICDEPAEETIRSKCKHEFCRKCSKDYVHSFEGTGGEPDCPRCHLPLSIDFEQPDIEQDEDYVKKNSIINRINMKDWTSSTKIEMLVYELYRLRSKKQTCKSIVFSQFTSMLQLVEWRLHRAGFNTVMLDGSMSPIQREKSINHFMNNVNVEVFLVSLKAGGVALNLTEASRVFIIDPWWNPAAEWQSADRCHRIGQRRPCVITRLVIEDSVESRIVMLQEKKANMIKGTINNDDVAIDKLTPEDMQFLFRGS
ncbi:MAG: DNA repair protein rad16 [Cirrosporium novae-zelandiae]|nr:MAG: DNA repair protein rad16 [Cirrosporium novae-zelandiae]